jgi:hypothetical protein
MGSAKQKRGAVVKVGDFFVRDYPARSKGDFCLTPHRDRAAQFFVADLPVQVAAELTAALGVRAQVLTADEEG